MAASSSLDDGPCPPGDSSAHSLRSTGTETPTPMTSMPMPRRAQPAQRKLAGGVHVDERRGGTL